MRHRAARETEGPSRFIATQALLTMALAAAGCGPVTIDDTETGATAVASSALVSQVPLGGLCPTRDAVSFELGAACGPPPDGWDVTRLVTDVAHGGVYCWYRAKDGAAPNFATLPPTAQRDCPVVIPQMAQIGSVGLPSASVSSLTRMSPESRSAAMAGAPPSPPAGTGNVHVAVLDTAPDSYDSPGADNNLHGRAVARTIAQLACTNPSACGDRVENRLAMSYLMTSFDPMEIVRDTDHGGSFGTVSELAGQLADVLNKLEAAPPDRRQIINLSLGWESEADGLFPSQAKAALNLLLQRAACLGAVTVAAAGNGARSGALSPAGWERTPAPDWAACKKAGFLPRFPFGTGHSAYRPLVYSVGAVDAVDRPLATSRPHSLPRLMAYGMSVSSGLQLPGSEAPPPLSGTSMSAAVTSAAAMAAWAVAPDLDPHDVMGLVYDSGVDLTGRGGPQMDNRSVEQCLPGPTPCDQWAMRRVSVCNALAAATTAVNAAANTGGAAPPSALLPVPTCATVAAYAMRDGPPATLRARWSLQSQTASPRSCAAATCASRGPREGDDLQPWTLPQPAQPSCSICRMTFPFNGFSYLWGSTRSTLVNPSYGLDLVITPYNLGVAAPEQIVQLNNVVAQDLPLDDWLYVGGAMTSATARFEFISPANKVIPTLETPIDVDPY